MVVSQQDLVLSQKVIANALKDGLEQKLLSFTFFVVDSSEGDKSIFIVSAMYNEPNAPKEQFVACNIILEMKDGKPTASFSFNIERVLWEKVIGAFVEVISTVLGQTCEIESAIMSKSKKKAA